MSSSIPFPFPLCLCVRLFFLWGLPFALMVREVDLVEDASSYVAELGVR